MNFDIKAKNIQAIAKSLTINSIGLRASTMLDK